MTTLLATRATDADTLVRPDDALLTLLRQLKARDYRFTTATPATHARVLRRSSRREAGNLRDVLGWSLPFRPRILDPEILETLRAADAFVPLGDGRLRSRYRVSTLGDRHLLHSAYPTDAEDAVFFGPDSYRFADLIRSELANCPRRPGARLVDIGTGAGVGAIVAAGLCPDLQITMTDINPEALRLARINAHSAGIEVDCALGADLDPVNGTIDIALANPPYIIDAAGRDYRDGGEMHGGRVSYDMAVSALDRLAPHGRFILYTGSAIIDGADPLRDELVGLARQRGCAIRYREIDPDVFGEELEEQAYRDVERIAVVAAVITRPGQ